MTPLRLALLGHPVAHSLSPAMHNTWLQEAGIVGRYDAIPIEESADFSLRAVMKREGLSGVNLTTPLKEVGFAQVDRLSPSARAAGAVNTVRWDGDDLVGYNTDGDGFCHSLELCCRPIDASMKVVILGAGGAARGILAALTQRGVTNVTILNRTESRARTLIDHFGQAGKMFYGPLEASAFMALASEADLVIQATSGGGAVEIESWSVSALAPDGIWVDLNYWMESQPQQDLCLRSGRNFLSGKPMLVCQGALAFELFTGKVANPSQFISKVR